MHDTAIEIAGHFFRTYADGQQARIVDIGALDVNGSLRSVAPPDCTYIGVDFVVGRGVDVVLDDPYHLPFETASIDICVCSSCFEHSEFFWLLFAEVQRILRPGGLFYLNVPSNGEFHRWPVDCWRFYPDSGIALQNWGRRCGFDTVLLESFTGKRGPHGWNDFVAVFLNGSAFIDRVPRRIQERYDRFTNGLVHGSADFRNPASMPEDPSESISVIHFAYRKSPPILKRAYRAARRMLRLE